MWHFDVFGLHLEVGFGRGGGARRRARMQDLLSSRPIAAEAATELVLWEVTGESEWPAAQFAARTTPTWSATILCFLLSAQPVIASAAQEPLPVPRLGGPVELDGRSDEPAWEAIPSLPLMQLEPVAGAPLGQRTEVRVAHDGDALYVAGRFYDSEPERIRVHSLTRDRIEGDDRFTLLLDTFDDNENAAFFVVTPAGTRRDAAISQDGEGPGSFNVDWNTFWDARTVRTEEGWFVEMRIPFSSLRFRETPEGVAMGITATRVIARSNEYQVYPALSAAFNRPYLKPSLAQDARLEGVQSATRPLHLTPYAVAGTQQAPALDATGAAYRTATTYLRDVGLDLKYGVSSNMTLDLTLNTDFAQVEADNQQVNLSRFSLFFPEKRPFFQERAGIFQFTLGGSGRLFYSRRIGLAGDGTTVPILGGARLVGRAGAWDVGALAMQTAGEGDRPGETFGAYRLRRQVLNANSALGGMVTHRLGADGSYDVAAGADGSFRVGEADYVSFSAAQTFSRGVPTTLRAGFLSAVVERRAAEGLGFDLRTWYTGRDFDPGVGFEPLSDAVALVTSVGYTWSLPESSRLRRTGTGANFMAYRRNGTGVVEQATGALRGWFEGKRGAFVGTELRATVDELPRPLPLPGGVTVPAGRYTSLVPSVSYNTPRGRALVADVGATGGAFYDGRLLGGYVAPTWFVSPNLDLGVHYEYTALRFPTRGQEADIHIGRVRARTALTPRLSATAFLQYGNLAKRLSANLRVRYNLRDGSDLWVVYDEGFNTDRPAYPPVLPVSSGRTLALKYSYTLP